MTETTKNSERKIDTPASGGEADRGKSSMAAAAVQDGVTDTRPIVISIFSGDPIPHRVDHYDSVNAPLSLTGIYNQYCCDAAKGHAGSADARLAIDVHTFQTILTHILGHWESESKKVFCDLSPRQLLDRRIYLTLASLRCAEWTGEYTPQLYAQEVAVSARNAHSTIKNTEGFYADHHDEIRENSFAQWCASMNIIGDTHEERVFAATIHYAPLIYRWLSEAHLSPDTGILSSSYNSLNRYLWLYDPSLDGDFLEGAKEKVMSRCSACIKRRDRVSSRLQSDFSTTINSVAEPESVSVQASQHATAEIIKSPDTRNSDLLRWATKNEYYGSTVVRIQGDMITQNLPPVMKTLYLHDKHYEKSQTNFAYRLLRIASNAFHPVSVDVDFLPFALTFIEKAKDHFSVDTREAIPECTDHEDALAFLTLVNSGKYVLPVAVESEADQEEGKEVKLDPSQLGAGEEMNSNDFVTRLFPVAKKALQKAHAWKNKHSRQILASVLEELVTAELQQCSGQGLSPDVIEERMKAEVQLSIVALHGAKTAKKR